MKQLTYKDFIWPVNPERLATDYRRTPIYSEDAQGNPVYLGMSGSRCTVEGSGEFTGPMALEIFGQLETLMAQTTSGILSLPGGGSVQAYFSRLTMEQDPRPEYVRYSFQFLGADETGAVPV